MRGRVATHSNECRDRIRKELEKTEEGQSRVERIDRRIDEALDEHHSNMEEHLIKRRRVKEDDDIQGSTMEQPGQPSASSASIPKDVHVDSQQQGMDGSDIGRAAGEDLQKHAPNELPTMAGKRDAGDDDSETKRRRLQNIAYYDDVTNKPLKTKSVIKARFDEMGYIRKRKLYTKVPRSHAEGYEIISTRWLGVNKGDNENENVRSRFVARQFNTSKDADVFAATPPTESLRYLLSRATTLKPGQI